MLEKQNKQNQKSAIKTNLQKSAFEFQDEESPKSITKQEKSNDWAQFDFDCPKESKSPKLDKQSQYTKLEPKEQNLLDLLDDSAHNEDQTFMENRILQIEGPQLINEGYMLSYKLYHIKSKLKDSAEKYDTQVVRRYSDFEYLQNKLVENYGGFVIPLLPQKNFWTSINLQGNGFIEYRKRSLQNYLRRLLMHQTLRITPQVKNFLFVNQGKFFENKGQFFSRIKAQDKVKDIASNAYNLGKSFLSKIVNPSIMQTLNININRKQIKIAKPTKEDIRLAQFEMLINDLMHVIDLLQKVVQNSINEIQMINGIVSVYESTDESSPEILTNESHLLLQEFQDLSKFIMSCNQALNRRKSVRLKLQELKMQEEQLQMKLKGNPRSHEMDIILNRITKTANQNEKWTKSLLLQFDSNVQIGKSMIEKFIQHFTDTKKKFYAH